MNLTFISLSINFLAVIVAAVAFMVVGFIWYAMPIFGRTWAKLIGKTPEQIAQGAKGPRAALLYGGMLVLAFVNVYVLAHVVNYVGATTFATGALTGFWMWLGFALPITGANIMFEGRSLRLLGIYTGYNLVTFVIAGMILAVWR